MERRIGIFVSGSTNPNISKEYNKTAIEFGKMIDAKKYNIIFDGCDGLPGLVASQLPKFNDNLEVASTTEHSFYSNGVNKWPSARINGSFRYQSEVTKALLDWSDVAVFFKGGSGTLYELFHAIDTKKNGEHIKPIIIVNLEHQWDELINVLEPLNLSHLYHVVNSPKKVMEYIEDNVKINSYNNVIYKSRDDDFDR